MRLNEISDKPGARTARTRVGRGIGSGKGRTAGRGMKGQKSRSGVALKGFEGGQMPIHRRLPKRGFRNVNGKRYAEVSLATLQAAIDKKKLDTSKPVTEALLKEAGIVTHLRDGVRVLGNGKLKARIDLVVCGATRSALAAVEAAGGSIQVTRPAAAGPEEQSGAADTAGEGDAGGGGAEGEVGADAGRDESGS